MAAWSRLPAGATLDSRTCRDAPIGVHSGMTFPFPSPPPHRGRLRVLWLGAVVLLACFFLGSSWARAEVHIQVNGKAIDLQATAAPLSEVLERLAKQTGMKVAFDGSAPRQLVTLSIRGRPLADTVLALFEGLGVNFALVTEADGAGVRSLVVTGSTAPSSSPPSPSRSIPERPSALTRPRAAEPDLPFEDAEPPQDDGFLADPDGGGAPPMPSEPPTRAPVPPPPNAAPVPTTATPPQPPVDGSTLSPWGQRPPQGIPTMPPAYETRPNPVFPPTQPSRPADAQGASAPGTAP